MESDKVIAKNKQEGLALGQTATGRTLGIVPVKGTGMVRVAIVDGQHGGQLPEWLMTGKFTSHKEAKHALDNFVAETWDIAEKHTKKKSAA